LRVRKGADLRPEGGDGADWHPLTQKRHTDRSANTLPPDSRCDVRILPLDIGEEVRNVQRRAVYDGSP